MSSATVTWIGIVTFDFLEDELSVVELLKGLAEPMSEL